jgi:hypothetical protein
MPDVNNHPISEKPGSLQGNNSFIADHVSSMYLSRLFICKQRTKKLPTYDISQMYYQKNYCYENYCNKKLLLRKLL